MKQKNFKDFEIKVLKILISNKLVSNELNKIIENAEFVGYEYTGVGYFLTVRHTNLPENRIVCSEPFIVGEVEHTKLGFVIFLENKELTFECFSLDGSEITENIRDKDLEISEMKSNKNK